MSFAVLYFFCNFVRVNNIYEKSMKQRHVAKPQQLFPQVVMYVKLPSYVRQWMTAIYGRPAVIPMCMSTYEVMLEHLRLTDLSRRRIGHNTCCSQLVFETPSVSLIPPEERAEYMAIVLPQHVTINGHRVSTTPLWNLTEDGAAVFRRCCNDQFWWDLEEFIQRTIFRCNRHRENFHLFNTIIDFLRYRHISTLEADTVRRMYHRRKSATTQKAARSKK